MYLSHNRCGRFLLNSIGSSNRRQSDHSFHPSCTDFNSYPAWGPLPYLRDRPNHWYEVACHSRIYPLNQWKQEFAYTKPVSQHVWYSHHHRVYCPFNKWKGSGIWFSEIRYLQYRHLYKPTSETFNSFRFSANLSHTLKKMLDSSVLPDVKGWWSKSLC